MKKTWEDNKKKVTEINKLWIESEELREKFNSKREEAAKTLQNLIDKIVKKAYSLHDGKVKVVPEPIIKDNKMVGLKIWVNDICQILE